MEDAASVFLHRSEGLEAEGKLILAFQVLEEGAQALKLTPAGGRIAKAMVSLCSHIVAEKLGDVLPVLKAADKAIRDWTRVCIQTETSVDAETIRLKVLLCTLWADYQKSQGHIELALDSLKKAIIQGKKLKSQPERRLSKAKTLLNISALYSELDKPTTSITFSTRALKLLQKDFTSILTLPLSTQQDLASSLVIGFFNTGAAKEVLGRRKSMTEAYKAGLAVGSKFLPPNNEIVSLIQSALSEKESRTSPRTMSGKEFKVALTERRAALTEVSKSKQPNSPVEKYYSDAQLQLLKAKLERDKRQNFISSDQYFAKKIGKMLGAPKPVPASKQRNEKQDRLTLTALKSKRKANTIPATAESERGHIRVQETLFQLSIQAAELSQKNQVHMLSKTKTKAFKQSLKTFARRGFEYNSSNPPQRLFFRHSATRSTELTGERRSSRKNGQENLEKMMDEIKLDLDSLSWANSPRGKSARGSRTTKAREESDLAKSTYREPENPKRKGVLFYGEQDVQDLAHIVDRKKSRQQTLKQPIQKMGSPMAFPYTEKDLAAFKSF